MTPRPISLRLISAALVAIALAGAGCGDDQLGGLAPELGVRPGSAPDGTGRANYLVEFGEVPIGGDGVKTFYVRNEGRATLRLSPLAVEAPFKAELADTKEVAPFEEFGLTFTFSPDAEGPKEALVTVGSDGGALTVRLTGTGRKPAPTDCAFDLAPRALDFGVGSAGQAKRLELRLVNLGANPCVVRQLKLGAGSDAAFAIEGGAVAEQSIGAFGDWTVAVTFTPRAGARGYAGELGFSIGPPGAAQVVPLKGALGDTPPATEPMYVNARGALYSWDPATRQALKVNDFFGASVGQVTDIAIDRLGTMVAVDSAKRLYVVNPRTAECKFQSTMKEFSPGLTFLPDGRLVASGTGVWVVSLATGAVLETLVAPGGEYDTSGDIVGLPDKRLYWAVKGANGRDRIVRVDPAAPAAQRLELVGELLVGSVFGLGYANGDLQGFTNTGEVLTISPVDARPLRAPVAIPGGSWWGATTNPVLW